MNAMIGLFPGNEYEGNSISREIETDLEPRGLHENTNNTGKEFQMTSEPK